MNTETLTKRISSIEKNLEKLNKKLEKILKAEESNYEENNPYYYNEIDKKYTLRDIEENNSKLEQYKKELEISIEKDNSKNIPAIIDFLNNWGEKIYSYISNGLVEVYKQLDRIRSYKAYSDDFNRESKIYNEMIHGKHEYKEVNGKRVKVKSQVGQYEYVLSYMHYNIKTSLKDLKNLIEKEKNSKYNFIIERTNKIVGEITDASNLRVGEKGDLNGIIIGTKGKASVNTVGAGGYNVQEFHFRTLIKEVR